MEAGQSQSGAVTQRHLPARRHPRRRRFLISLGMVLAFLLALEGLLAARAAAR